MHPPLLRPHPQCGHVVKLLVQCHEENKFAKYFGACNDQKVALDQCFRAEKELKRRQNLAKALKFEAKRAAANKRRAEATQQREGIRENSDEGSATSEER